jgi:hypothetical protein
MTEDIGGDDRSLQCTVADVRMNLGRRNRLVAEKALNEADINARFHQCRRGGVPEHVGVTR